MTHGGGSSKNLLFRQRTVLHECRIKQGTAAAAAAAAAAAVGWMGWRRSLRRLQLGRLQRRQNPRPLHWRRQLLGKLFQMFLRSEVMSQEMQRRDRRFTVMLCTVTSGSK